MSDDEWWDDAQENDGDRQPDEHWIPEDEKGLYINHNPMR